MQKISLKLIPFVVLFVLILGVNPQYSNAQDDTNPLAHWDFSGGKDSDVLKDVSGNNHDGQLINFNTANVWQSTQGKAYVEFDKADQYINVPDTDNFTFGDGISDQPYSITAYIYPTNFSDSNVIISKYTEDLVNGEWVFDLSKGKLRITNYSYQSTKSYIQAETKEALRPNQWYHITVTYDGSKNRTGFNMFIEGLKVEMDYAGQGNYIAMSNKASDLNIGSLNSGTAGLAYGDFSGQIYDVKIFDKVITDTYIVQDRENVSVPCRGGTFLPNWICPIVSQLDSAPEANNYVNARVRLILYLVFTIVLIIAIVYSALAGIKYIMSSGEQGKVDEAKEALKAILYGFGASILAVAGIFVVYWLLGGTGPLPSTIPILQP